MGTVGFETEPGDTKVEVIMQKCMQEDNWRGV